MRKPAIFLDRDGTLNVEKNYLYKPADWEWIDGSIDAIHAFNKAGYAVIVTTNQSGIARGFFSLAEVNILHAHVDRLLTPRGAHIDAYYICPHHPDFGEHRACDCRKPKPGMLHQAAHEHGLDLARSWMVGDKASDVAAGQAAGTRSILVTTGHGEAERAKLSASVPCVSNLAAAARIIFSVS